MAINIVKEARDAAEWLANIARSTSKLNPIPYPFLKSCINTRIGWAKDRGETLDPDNLEELIRSELKAAGIQALPNKFKKAQPLQVQKQDSSAPSKDWSYFLQVDNVNSTLQLFKWLFSVLDNAAASHPKGIRFSAQFDWRIDF